MNNTIREPSSDRVFNAAIAFICIILLIITVYPMYFVIIASVSSPVSVANGDVWFYPKGLTLLGYEEIFKDNRIWTGLTNTLIYTFGGIFVSLLFTIPAGYALSRSDFKPRHILMLFYTITMFFGGGLIPTYLAVKQFQIINTIWVMLIPFSVSVFNMIIARTYFSTSIPKELFESARLDGCSDLQYFIRIALPLSKALIAVLGLWYGVGYWNEYFKALVYLNDAALHPIQLILRDILVLNQSLANQAGQGAPMDSSIQQKADLIKYGMIVVSSMPIIAMFPFVQKYFEKGTMIGSIKG